MQRPLYHGSPAAGQDGSLQLLGRGSVCINTGGEKVFPETPKRILRVALIGRAPNGKADYARMAEIANGQLGSS